MTAQRHGPEILSDGGVNFRLWAPSAKTVGLLLEDDAPLPMQPSQDGWYALECRAAAAGSRYKFLIDGALEVPDPASRLQPDGVMGASMVAARDAFPWSGNWSGRSWHEAVIYELHIGTFTSEGTFVAAEKRLDHLAATGITAVELMPLAAFRGARGWGYDGVLPFAPHPAYGTPDELKAFIASAHARNIMVFLDVVYNHFGPEGNFLHAYAEPFFTEAHHTPWGAAINFEGEAGQNVRRFYMENAMYWLDEFRFDGLRFDAAHAIRDDSPRHFLNELAETVRQSFSPGRHIHLILENYANQSHFLERRDGGPIWFTAQWNDDIHHVLHSLITDEREGYYADFIEDRMQKLGRTLTEGFVYQGETSVFRDGEKRGEPSASLPPSAFVAFLQNHDQIGNRAFGERLTTLTDERHLVLASAIVLLGPQIPMLFMGEEWQATTPFLYFCDFTGETAEAIRSGRRKEFEKFSSFATIDERRSIPDPSAFASFSQSRLDWTQPKHEPFHSRLAFTRHLLALRREFISPLLEHPVRAATTKIWRERVLCCRWEFVHGKTLLFAGNFSDSDVEHPFEEGVTSVWGHLGAYLPGWKCVFALESVS